MNIKTELLKILDSERDAFVSGEALANSLSVSRNAVWKAIEALRLEGYDISATTNRGYRLLDCGDILSEAGIMAHIKTKGIFQAEVRKSVSSTNTALRELAVQGIPEGYVLAAEMQTAGKGRKGRGFHSPAGHGVYFSLLLRPEPNAGDASMITSAAAVAAARAIEDIFGIQAGIKWVNDLFVDGKKVCGILTEAVFGMESGMIENAVLGIGINVTKPPEGFPDGLEDVATTLTGGETGKNSVRCRLIAATLDHFWGFYQSLAAREFLNEYRDRSVVLGRDIFVLSGDEKKLAHALTINDDCGLVVRYEDGRTESLRSGEVSVRAVQN